MLTILNTHNSKTREEALNKIIKNMNSSSSCKPLAYHLDGSGCSCCLSEYFYLLCKINNDYKILSYDGYINHTDKCVLVRCSCREPFIWKNINPTEKTFGESEIQFLIENMTPIKDFSYIQEYQLYLKEQKYFDNLQKYIDEEDDKMDRPLKNFSYYF